MAEALWGSSQSSGTAIEGGKMSHIGGGTLDIDIRNSLQKLWDNRAYTDVTIKAGERAYNSHKFLLAAHCSYFKDLPDFENQTRVTLKLDPEVFQLVLTYVYLGQLDISLDQVHALLAAADFLGFDALKSECKHALLSENLVHPDTCLQVWIAAYENDNKDMCTKALEVALEHFPRLLHDSSFRQLPPGCVIKYLSHPRLQVFGPEDRLNACLVWIKEDKQLRAVHMTTFLDKLPLQKMKPWFLKQVMDDSLITDQQNLKRKIQKSMEDNKQENNGQMSTNEGGINGAMRPMEAQENPKTTCLLLLGAYIEKDGVYLDRNQTLQAVSLDGNPMLIDLGEVGPNAEIAGGVRLCTHENIVFISGLGKMKDEVWKYQVFGSKLGKGERLGTLATKNRYQCMAFHNGYLYIAGRYDETEAIEIWDTEKGTSQIISCPQLRTEGEPFSMEYACCVASENLVLYTLGKYPYKKYKKSWFDDNYTWVKNSMVHVFPLAKKYVSHSITVDDDNNNVRRIFCAGENLILVSEYNIKVTELDAVINNKSPTIWSCDNFRIPNACCAVTLTEDKKSVMLYGGDPQSKKPHFVYTASVDDIVHNSGCGWTRVHTTWPLGACKLFAYDTIDMDIQKK